MNSSCTLLKPGLTHHDFSILLSLLVLYCALGSVLWLLICSSLCLDHCAVMPEKALLAGAWPRPALLMDELHCSAMGDPGELLHSTHVLSRVSSSASPFLFQVEAFKRPSFSEILDESEDVAESLEPRRENQLLG